MPGKDQTGMAAVGVNGVLQQPQLGAVTHPAIVDEMDSVSGAPYAANTGEAAAPEQLGVGHAGVPADHAAVNIGQSFLQAGKLRGKDLHPGPVEGEENGGPFKAAVQLRQMGGLAFVLGVVKAQGAEEIIPGRFQAVTEAVSGKAEVAIFL